ncbi:MAG: putative 2,4-dienoyl-CoA reductase [Myxococcota bacterium]|nr:putative 2,4-dienoyl-CoA reductase [Myxococcota bacterium]
MVFAPDFLQDQVAIITGGGTGIGLEIARAMARHGARLAIASRNPAHYEPAVRELNAIGPGAVGVKVNIRDAESVDAMTAEVLQRYGRIDILINNAGANFLSPAISITPNGWRAVVETVLNGTFFCSKSVAPHMMERGFGRIIMMAATNGWNASPAMAHSGAAKAGIINLAETLAAEWGPAGIRVNALCPGPVRTEGSDERLWMDKELVARLEQQIPLGRFALPADIVGPTLFLCSPASDFITGGIIALDGGDRLRNLRSFMGG